MLTVKTKIETVRELIFTLNKKDGKGSQYYLEVMKSVDISRQNFEQFFIWSSESYSRVCLSRTPDYELLLICWEKGQQSPIHDFDSHEAWVHPIIGRIREERFIINEGSTQLEKVSSVSLGDGDFSYMNKSTDIHRYSNIYDTRSVSLNLYSKPVDQWTIYESETGATTRIELKYNACFENGKRIY